MARISSNLAGLFVNPLSPQQKRICPQRQPHHRNMGIPISMCEHPGIVKLKGDTGPAKKILLIAASAALVVIAVLAWATFHRLTSPPPPPPVLRVQNGFLIATCA